MSSAAGLQLLAIVYSQIQLPHVFSMLFERVDDGLQLCRVWVPVLFMWTALVGKFEACSCMSVQMYHASRCDQECVLVFCLLSIHPL
jgi:hypothetical protein